MDLPIVDLDVFRTQPADSAAAQAECSKAAEALIAFGALVLHDSRVSEADNDAFLDLLEDYFAQPEATLRRDERPALGYQVGVTLENTETPKCAVDEPCLDVIARLAPEERPLDIAGHQPDPKCRFFWRVVEPTPYQTAFPGLNADNVVPDAALFRERWEQVMGRWGAAMKDAVSGVASMAAVGLGLPPETFADAGRYGPHLLAPTASDLQKYGALDTILAGFHTDLNFLTIHGRSRFPGLHIWARNTGRRIAVSIPPGRHLLVQAGKQLEHLSGGLIKAGYHEVVVNNKTQAVVAARRAAQPDRPLIRISSTFFWHLASDWDLAPLPALAARARDVRTQNAAQGRDEGAEVSYPPIKVGQQVQKIMASWDDLPFELKRLIFRALEYSVPEHDAAHVKGRRKRGPAGLAPLAAVNSQWRDAIEAITFQGLIVKTSEVNDFEGYFRQNPRRQAALRRVCILVELPRYASRLSRVCETEEELDTNDSIFSDTLWHFFSAMSAWDADVLRQHYKSPGVALEIVARSTSDKPALFGEKGISDSGESRFFESQLDLNIGAMHEPYGRVGLPEVAVVTTFSILRRNHRCMTPRSLLHILHSLPRLTPKKLTLYRFSDAFNMDEQVWGHDERYPFLARRIAEYSPHLEELAVSDFIDADHFFEPFYTPQRRLHMPYWHSLRVLALTSTSICSGRPEVSIHKLLHAAALAARRMPVLRLMELYNAEPNEGGVFRYLVRDSSASIAWESSWDFRIPDNVRQAWAPVPLHSHRLELEVLPEETLPRYVGPAWFVHARLMSRPYLLNPASSREIAKANELDDFEESYRDLSDGFTLNRRERDVPRPSRREQEIEAVKNGLKFLADELERLQSLDEEADRMDEEAGLYDHVFKCDTDMIDRDSNDSRASIEIMYQDDPDADEDRRDEDDEAWETE
ncbi:oxoglutarate/iron-dependent oxygenase [Grosmannia clavigera kw1407]|uniref:Oxoglutarate/iron-dependent oxygenase n=1 Tax=Grosmannia clavigera (strain kw1407 / UAMH 11150) TaxID=655863 RepID=F0XPJ1_GROCL|nr:oxoglutarate/iron-dependent oxygenase [Grosmannia clavigera kw1407]EFX00553.1 oxoglutarate/iron-dependent oxygenase [Grosmannia clavigera kw1407]